MTPLWKPVPPVVHCASAAAILWPEAYGDLVRMGITADRIADWMGGINYEVVSGIHPSQPKFVSSEGK